MSESHHTQKEMAYRRTPGETPEAVQTVQGALQVLRNNNVYPVAQYKPEATNLLQNEEVESKRPFMVFEVAVPDPTIETAIAKVRTVEDPDGYARNEQLFLKQLAPQVLASMPAESAEKIILPTIYASGNEGIYSFIVEAFVEGKTLGTVQDIDTSLIETADIDALVDFMKALSTIDVPAAEAGLTLDRDYARHAFERFSLYLLPGQDASGNPTEGRYVPRIVETLGEDTLGKMQAQLLENQELLSRPEVYFAAVDINPSNIIKTDEGKLGIVDWERVAHTNNPSYDYSMMLAVLGSIPEMQQHFLRKALEVNKEIPDFKEYLRLTFLMFRGPGLLWHWHQEAAKATNPKKKQECEEHVNRYRRQLNEALDATGLWA